MTKESLQLQSTALENTTATIDWDYIKAGKGVRKIENVLQVVLGKILVWSILVANSIILVYEIFHGHFFSRLISVDGIGAFIFWILAGLFLYALYLLRDRERFLDTPRKYNLYTLHALHNQDQQPVTIEIVEYLNHKVFWIVDYLYNVQVQDILWELMRKLLKLKKTNRLLARIGLSKSQLDISVVKDKLQDKSKQEIIHDLLLESFLFSYQNGMKLVNEEVLFLIILKKFYAEYLQQFNILQKDLEGIELWLRNEALIDRYVERWKSRVSIKPKTTVNRAYTSRYTPTLNTYAREFTQAVIQGEFTISLAREKELAQLITVLEKGEKSGALVIGEPGVGKTTLIKSLAVRMVVEDVPQKLQDKRLVGFDFNKAFSSSRNIESFKKKLRSVFDEVAQSTNVILVLDNVHQLLNLRPELAGEIVNIIVDSFDRTKIRMIATTDRAQYQRFIRPHKALAGIFTIVQMEVPSDEAATQILIDEVPAIEGDYNVKISYSAIKGAIELSHNFSYNRVLPDKAIDLLKETVVQFKDFGAKKPITYDQVAQVVSSKVGVQIGSVSEGEAEKLARLEDEMHKRVIDQNEAIKAVCGALRRLRSGLADDKKPVASFLFFGPTGVGKTEVAKTVAETYFGNEEQMVRIDMSEYHEEENLNRLIGFTSDQGAFEGGFLTEAVHNNPFSLVLLDEIDKANPKVLDLFLQVLDEGYLDDGLGRRIDFSNTIIIATSNAGSSVIAELIEKNVQYEQVMEKALDELKKLFRIEFLNRFDKLIMFKPLNKDEITLIAKKFVEQIRLKLLDKGITLKYDQKLLERLASLGYNPVFGAREMKRVVQEEVETKVANMIIQGEAKAGEEVYIT